MNSRSARNIPVLQPGTAEARTWLLRQVSWERTLSALRRGERVSATDRAA